MKNLRNIFFVIICFLFFCMSVPELKAQGHYEFGFHYSSWSINILKGVLEEGMSDALETDLRDEFFMIPSLIPDPYKDKTCQEPCDKGNPEVYKYAFGDLCNGNIDNECL